MRLEKLAHVEDDTIASLVKIANTVNNLRFRIKTATDLLSQKPDKEKYLKAAIDRYKRQVDSEYDKAEERLPTLEKILEEKKSELERLTKEHEEELGIALVEEALGKEGQPVIHREKGRTLEAKIGEIKEVTKGLEALIRDLKERMEAAIKCVKRGGYKVAYEPIQIGDESGVIIVILPTVYRNE